MGKILLEKGHLYKVRQYCFDKGYTIMCPNESVEIEYATGKETYCYKYLKCIFRINGTGKKSYLYYKRETFVPVVRATAEIRKITKKDYVKIQKLLKQNNLLYNKKTQELINTLYGKRKNNYG